MAKEEHPVQLTRSQLLEFAKRLRGLRDLPEGQVEEAADFVIEEFGEREDFGPIDLLVELLQVLIFVLADDRRSLIELAQCLAVDSEAHLPYVVPKRYRPLRDGSTTHFSDNEWIVERDGPQRAKVRKRSGQELYGTQ